MEEEGSEIPTITAGGAEEDRISALPDAIIHDILARLRSPKEAAKATVLSKRWTGIWRSYPILEYTEKIYQLNESTARFVAAATAKFTDRSGLAIDAVRISVDSARHPKPRFCYPLDDLLQLAAATKSLPQEIDIKYYCNVDPPVVIPQALFLPYNNNNNNNQFRLRVLRLQNCEFHQDIINVVTEAEEKEKGSISNPFAGLRELCLRSMTLGSSQFLNNIIAAAAANLQSLTLDRMQGIRAIRIRIRNLPSLKVLRVIASDPDLLEELEITEGNTLETLDLDGIPLGVDLKASLIPNLKVVRIQNAPDLTDDKVNKLISASPSLESLALVNPVGVRKLKIGRNNTRLREIRLEIYRNDLSAMVIEMDASSGPGQRRNIYYDGCVDACPQILVVGGDDSAGEDGQSLAAAAVSFCWELYGYFDVNLNDFRRRLESLSRFRLTLRFIDLFKSWVKEEVGNNLPVLRIEEVEFPSLWRAPCFYRNAFVNELFQLCRPKYLSFSRQIKDLWPLEDIRKQFKETEFTERCRMTSCRCWRHELKDIKLVKRTTNNNITIEDEDIKVDVSVDTYAFNAKPTQVVFLLTWN